RDFHVTGVQTCALPIFGIAAAEDAGAQPASVADQLPPDQDVSQMAIELAGWVVATRDSQGYPFAVIDKQAAQILVFGADGRLREIGRASCREGIHDAWV